MNQVDKARLKQMEEIVKGLSGERVYDLGGGQSSIIKDLDFEEKVIVDGDPSLKPDILADLNNPLPIEDGCADLVIAGEIIEHLINPFRFLLEAEMMRTST